jgi:predicted RND superfamily exporter protein
VAAVTLALGLPLWDFGAWRPRLQVQIEVEKILPESALSPERQFYDRFRETFGNDEVLLVGLFTDDVFTAENLRTIQRITERLAELDGVRRVLSLANAPDVRQVDGSVLVLPAYAEVPEDPEELAALRTRVLANPMHVGSLVSRDGSAAAFLVHPAEMSEREFRESALDERIERVVREESGRGEVALAGVPPIKAGTGRLLLRDLNRFVPLAIGFMALVAWLSSRTLRGVVLPLAALGLAQAWTMGLLTLSGRGLNLVTFVVPPLILTVGFAYAVHVVTDHADVVRERGAGGSESAAQALRRGAGPVTLCALTTAAGFLSLCISDLPAIREFGALCVVGVLASLLASLTMVPAVLALLPAPPGASAAPRWPALDALAVRLAEFDVRHRRSIFAATAAVALVAAWGISRIEVGTSFLENLKPGDPLRLQIERFNERFDGSATFHVVLEGPGRDAFKEAPNVEQLRELQVWLEAQPEVNGTTSIADHLRVVNRAFHDGDEQQLVVPPSRSLISKYLFFFWHPELEGLVDPTFAKANLVVRVPHSLGSREFADLLGRIQARLATVPSPLAAQVTGATAMITWTVDDIARGQAESLAVAAVVIFGVLWAFFRSAGVALLALVPNALPVLVYFGVLGLAGVTLNVITSLIACIVLGIAVDDTIHVLSRFRERLQRVGDRRRAAVEALCMVVRPVTVTSLALALGFLVLATSGLEHQVEFGVLAAVMLAFAWLADVTLTPAIASVLPLPHREASNPDHSVQP